MRSKRVGVDIKGTCDINAPLIVRGDIVSLEMEDGRTVDFPEDWGLVHDVSGHCAHKCEIFVCPYSKGGVLRHQIDTNVHEAASSYWGKDYEVRSGKVVIPSGPWDKVGRIVRVYYDRYGELASPYQHPFEEVKGAAILFKQRQARECVNGRRHKVYRISLPDGCVVNAHGFVWP